MSAAGFDPEAVPRTSAEVFELRKAYWNNGYRPVPVYTRQKRPRGDGWRDDALQDPPVWADRKPEDVALSTGLATGRTVAVDVDVLIQAVVDRIVFDIEQDLGRTQLVRIGLAPKTLLGFRCEQPFRKLSTGIFVMPDNSEAKIEVLADGQQFVADGIHPDTGRAYSWPAGAPETVPLDKVPTITFGQARAIIAKARELLRANGGIEKTSPPPALKDKSAADNFFAKVNEAALRNLAAWVKALFSRAAYQPGTGAWRVASKDRGRPDLQEDISIHPDGIQDFGLEKPLTPIDLVIEHSGAADPVAAALWLCAQLGIDSATLGWQQRRHGDQRAPPPPHDEADYGTKPQRTEEHPPAYAEWPEPLDLFGDLLGSPTLNSAHLPDALGGFVFDTATRLGTNPSAVALAAVVTSAAALAADWVIQPKQHDYTWIEQALLWGLILGGSSVYKTPVLKAATAPFERLEAKARKLHDQSMQRYKSDLAAWKKAEKEGRGGDQEPPHPKLPRYLIKSTTVEALSEVLRTDHDAKQQAPLKKVLVLQDEFSEFIANQDRYRTGGKGNTDRGAYLRFYNGGPDIIDRVMRGPVFVENWGGCILGGIQPGPIQRIAREAEDDGLLQRNMYDVAGEARTGEDRAPDRAALERYEKLIPLLTTLHPERLQNGNRGWRVTLHPDARQYAEQTHTLARAAANLPDTSERLKSALGKWPGLFARLALTFHLIEVADARLGHGTEPPLYEVQLPTAAKVAAYMREILLPNLLRAEAIMFATVQTGHAQWIAGFILGRGLERIEMRDIVQSYKPLRAPECAQERDLVMAALELAAWIEPQATRNPAKGVRAWWVNPKVHERFARQAAEERARRDAIKAAMQELAGAKR